MNWMNNFTIRSRLWAAFGLVLGLMTLISVLGIRGSLQSQAELDALIAQDLRKFELTADINAATRANARHTMQLFIASQDEWPAIRGRMATIKTEIDGYFAALGPMLVLPEGRALFAELQQKRNEYVAAFTAAAEALQQGGEEAGLMTLNARVVPAIDALAKPIDALQALQKDIAHQRGEAAKAAVQQQIVFSVVLGGLAVLLGVVAAWSLVVSIARPLEDAKQATQTMARGDLSVRIPLQGHNEITDMMESLDHMRESLSHVLSRIQQSTEQVASASSQISAANMDLSSRTEEQASALEQTAATMEELTSTVQQNANTAGNARQLAEQASQSAKGVGTLMADVVTAMRDIHDSSQRIRDIVSVIDSIAFQTNILALNAAVEAARAGDQGRGFAVVASEVRALAQRSASAAQEIKVIIEENVSKMDRGNQQAQRAGSAVDAAVHNIENVTTIISEVDNASREQSMGIGQVGEAVGQMDIVTQQNAALVEETAAATKNLDDQVQGLKAQISRFQIGSISSGAQPQLLPA